MDKQLKVLVLGGNGFIGRQIVNYLRPAAQVTVGTRKTQTQVDALSVSLHKTLSTAQWLKILRGFDVVVNAVGILRACKNESYQAVHSDAVGALALASKQLNIKLIHVSAIGLTANAKSAFIRSKYSGEQAIIKSKADATIVRPSLLGGTGGYGAKWFRQVARWPLQFVMQSNGLIAPLQVEDLGQAIANLVLAPPNNMPGIMELGGTKQFSIPDYLQYLRQTKKLTPAQQVAIPKLLVRAVSHMFDVLNWTPLSFGHYELMQGYNVPETNWLPKLLGRAPSDVGWPCLSEEVSVVVA